MEPSTLPIPPAFYLIVGVLIVTNLSAIGGIIVLIFKAGQFVEATKLGIKDAKESAVNAHKRLNALTGERTDKRLNGG